MTSKETETEQRRKRSSPLVSQPHEGHLRDAADARALSEGVFIGNK